MIDGGQCWLVTGGAGYIGSHVVRALRNADVAVVVIDDLSSGVAERVADTPFVLGSVLDEDLLATIMDEFQIDGVIHFAARKQVAESVSEPLLYYGENVGGLRSLLSAMRRSDVNRIVYSSSAAVYGIPSGKLVDEETPCQPISPYGETKLVGEWLLRAESHARSLRYAAMRYFNVAGTGHPLLSDRGCTNLIPITLAALNAGLHPTIFGVDYDTPDGTCVRDYIHVEDIASAHVAAASLLNTPVTETFNVGRGHGYSVRQVMAEIASTTGIDIAPDIAPRREGDPASVVADIMHIRRRLGWQATHNLKDIVQSAWAAWPAASSQP